ncbi:hypothetical protein SDC9_157443 [bioreactor metagenome]|uniref:Uncharacterized protein n=1 Tax=bioreactor metagenome TaxID=1076179 RepID=A0A645F6Z3_9ZZZZ
MIGQQPVQKLKHAHHGFRLRGDLFHGSDAQRSAAALIGQLPIGVNAQVSVPLHHHLRTGGLRIPGVGVGVEGQGLQHRVGIRNPGGDGKVYRRVKLVGKERKGGHMPVALRPVKGKPRASERILSHQLPHAFGGNGRGADKAGALPVPCEQAHHGFIHLHQHPAGGDLSPAPPCAHHP